MLPPRFDFYTETKTIYVDFSGGLQRAQIDNYVDEPAASDDAVPQVVAEL